MSYSKRGIRRAGHRCSAIAMAIAGVMGSFGSHGFGVSPAFAQTVAGTIRGNVTDEASGVALEGARITIVENGRRAATDRAGAFTIGDLPDGTYTVRVDYLGLPQASQIATVAGGKLATLKFRLGDSSESRDIVVTAVADDITKKLNQERASLALTEIAASSTSAEFPDRNLGEVLQRLTGVFVDRNGTGEGNVLLVRSISAANNLVLIEGQRLPSGRADGRTPNLATINADVIESAEVRKVFTPEIPGDFFGGYVNIKQSSGFDRSGPSLSASVETARRSITNNGLDFEASVRASDRLLDDTLGIAVGLGVDKRDATFHQYNVTRSPNNVTGALTIPALFPSLFQFREVVGQISRYSASLAIDYRPSDENQYYIKAFANYGKEETNDTRVNVLFAPTLLAGATPILGTYSTLVPELERIKVDRPERFLNIVVGGENKFDDWGVMYSLGFNRLSADQDNAVRFTTRATAPRAGGATYDFRDPSVPLLTLANPTQLSTLGTYGTTVAPSTNLAEIDEEQVVAQINVLRTFRNGDTTFEVRGGLRFDQRQRSSNVGGAQIYAPFAIAASYAIPGPTGLFRNQFGLPLVLDFNALSGVFATPTSDRPPGDANFLASIAGDFTGRDRIYAAYLMARYEHGGLQLAGGVRYERTESSGVNFAINRALYRPTDPDPLDDDPSDGVARQRPSSTYSRWLPALTIRYEPRENLLFRAALSKTYARPTLPQILGGEVVNPGLVGTNDRSVSRGNPTLVPQNSWNFDASVDIYGSSASVLRVGMFYKSISKVFYTASLTEPNAFGGTDFVTQPQNGGDARVFGIEAGLIQRLSFLPSPLDRFSVELNAGLSWSNQQVLNAAGAIIRETDLEGSYGFIGNASLVYRGTWGRARVAYRYSGTRLNAIDTNVNGEFNDAFRDRSGGLDADISLNISKQVSVSLEARNLLNRIEVSDYLGNDRNNLTRSQYSGRSFGLGVKIIFY